MDSVWVIYDPVCSEYIGDEEKNIYLPAVFACKEDAIEWFTAGGEDPGTVIFEELPIIRKKR